MNDIVNIIKKELLKRCENYKNKNGYDFWNDHIKYVVENANMLAEKYGADEEIVVLRSFIA